MRKKLRRKPRRKLPIGCHPDGFLGARGGENPLGAFSPAEGDHPPAELEAQGDLGKGAVRPLKRDQSARRGGDDGVSGVAHSGANFYVNVGVRVPGFVAGQDAHCETARGLRPAPGGLHDAPQPAAHQRGAPLGEAAAHLLGEALGLAGGFGVADNGNKDFHLRPSTGRRKVTEGGYPGIRPPLNRHSTTHAG